MSEDKKQAVVEETPEATPEPKIPLRKRAVRKLKEAAPSLAIGAAGAALVGLALTAKKAVAERVGDYAGAGAGSEAAEE